MDYEEMEMMEDDPLKLLKFISHDIFTSKIAKIFLWLLFSIHTTVTLLTAYFFIYKLQISEFASYGPAFFGFLYAMCAILAIIFKGKIIGNIKSDISMWSIDSVGKEVATKIKKDIFLILAYALATLILVFIACCLFAQPLFADKEIFFAFRLIDDYCPNQKIIFTCIYRTALFLGGFTMTVHIYQVLYYLQHFKFQIMMYIECIRNIGNCCTEKKEVELFYDESYQKEIRRRLLFCIKRYREYIHTHRKKVEEMNMLIAVFSIVGCLLGISIVFSIFSQEFYPEYVWRLGAASLAAITTAPAIMFSGQSIETENENIIAAATELPWYNFNDSNKRTYQIFLINTMKIRKIQFSENYSVNLSLGLQIIKAIYSVSSVAHALTKSQNSH